VNSVVAVEENQVAKDASDEDQSQTGNEQDKRTEEDWIKPEAADASKAGEKKKYGACDEAGLNQVDD
jgi:hypothetical protein